MRRSCIGAAVVSSWAPARCSPRSRITGPPLSGFSDGEEYPGRTENLDFYQFWSCGTACSCHQLRVTRLKHVRQGTSSELQAAWAGSDKSTGPAYSATPTDLDPLDASRCLQERITLTRKCLSTSLIHDDSRVGCCLDSESELCGQVGSNRC